LLRIRLRRTGKKKQPSYRLVVADSRAPRDGNFVETIGLYDPLTDPPTIRIKEDRARDWMSKGAQPSETVAKLIPNGVVALAWFPDARRELAASPALMPNAVEEMLRWDPPSHYQGRATTRDVQVRDTVIPAGQRVILVTGSAVHDERKYPDPDAFDIHRDIDRHVSFGFGRHLCLGASLARLETRVAFEELLKRFPDFSIDEAGVERNVSVNVRGLSRLPLVVESRTAV